MRSRAERPSGATSTSYSASASVFCSRSRMLASSSTTRTRGLALAAAGFAAAAACAAGRPPPRGRWLSSQASMSRLRNRHCRPTRTAGILPALISRYTVRRLTCRYSSTSSVVRNVSSIMLQRPGRCDRQFNGEHGPALRMVCGEDLAAVLLHDAVRDGQPEPRSLADLFRRVERLEDARQRVLGDADAGVAQRRDDAIAR